MLNQAISDYKTAAEQATAALEPKREAVQAAAIARRDELAEQISNDSQRAALAEIIVQALSRADEGTRTNAPAVFSQFVAAQIRHPDALKSRIVLEVFFSAAEGLPNAVIRQALEAILLAATGAVTAGLYQWNDPWHKAVSVDVLEQFVNIIDESAHRLYAEAMSKLRDEHRAACTYAVEYANPVTISTNEVMP